MSSRPDLWKHEDNQASQPFAVAAVAGLDELLNALDIRGEARQRIRQGGLALEALMAWYLYACNQEWTHNPAGYVIERASAGEPPPENYARLSRLSWECWRTYAAVVALRPLLAPEQLATFAGMPLFDAWLEQFGHLLPESLPFEVGAGLAELQPLLSQARAATPDNAARNDGASPAPDQASLALWRAGLEELSLQMTRATFNAWLQDAQLIQCEGDEFVIAAASPRARAWLENRLYGTICNTLKALSGRRDLRLRFVVNSDLPNRSTNGGNDGSL